MARIATGSIAGMHVELVTDRLELHGVVTELDDHFIDELRGILNEALGRVIQLVEHDDRVQQLLTDQHRRLEYLGRAMQDRASE